MTKMNKKAYELTNEQRKYFGLEPIEKHWEKVILAGDTYRKESILYFDGDIIRRHILTTENEYFEKQYDELTRDKTILLPKTTKGKEKKLTASVLEQRTPIGVYLKISMGHLRIGNYTTHITFYTSAWEKEQELDKTISELVDDFISESAATHLDEITLYKKAKKKNIKFKSGDYFCFKLDRTHYGFGRVLLDISKIKKKKLIGETHGLQLLMGPPVIVELFAYRSDIKQVAIEILEQQAKLPSDVMMDNLLFYGEYEIIGNKPLTDQEFSFPISYGRSVDQRAIVFLQWGLIHKEIPMADFNQYIYTDERPAGANPYGYYGIGFSPGYGEEEIVKTIQNNGVYNFEQAKHYRAKWDLRNPKNKEIKRELFQVFGLDPDRSYIENSIITETPLPGKINSQL